MELQFDKQPISCLNQVKWEQKNQELTQEIRLTEDLPDVGSVLGAWGQTIVRGKQWRKGNMEVTGGVMVFVLYAPEDGSAPHGTGLKLVEQIARAHGGRFEIVQNGAHFRGRILLPAGQAQI